MGMPSVKMTDAAINALPLGSGTYLITTGSRKADNLRGFMLVANAASASFVIQRKVKGKSVRVKLGVRGEITVAQAHGKAVEALKRLNEGENPNATRRAARDEENGRLTLRSTFERYISEGARAGELRPKTIELYRHILNKHLYSMLDRTMLDIGQDKFGLSDLHERVTRESGWAAANNSVKVLSYVYNRALDFEDDLPANPKRRVKMNPEVSRDTALSDSDVPGWFAQVMKLSNPVKRAYWFLVFMTAGRRSQVAAAEWSHIDFDRKKKGDKTPLKPTWRFPDENTKMGHGYTIALSPFVAKFLEEWRKYVESEYPVEPQVLHIFPSAKTDEGHLKAPRNEKQGLKVSAHPLRHSYRTQGVAVGLSEIESKLLMGHKLSKSNMGERYVTRENTPEYMRPKQEAMTKRYCAMLGLTDASIKEIIWSKVPRGAGKTT
jgi:integrase